MNLKKFNFYGGITSSVWLLFILIVGTELSADFKGILTSLLFHHWIAKALLTALIFLIVGIFFKDCSNDEKTAYWSTIAVSLLILIFFIALYFFGG